MCYGVLGPQFLPGGNLAYQVIARKFRPQAFSELVGQKHVTQTLLNAFSADRFPHAILFNGPRGTGKTSSARIIAKILLCKDLKDSTPCHQCQSCQDVSSGRHLDVIEIDGASNNGVDHIRELRDTVGYMPASGSHKIYIIDEVHMLSTSAFNALLKTLEEPPPHVIFIFATTEVQKIPATILSRCQRFDFRTLSLSEIKQHLEKICQNEGVEAEEAALWMLAKQAKGSIRDSLTLLDQVISFGQNKISQQTIMDVLGLSDRGLLFGCLKAITTQNKSQLFDLTSNLLGTGYDPLLFLEEFMEILRHALMVKIGIGKENLEIPESEVEELGEIVSSMAEEEIQLLFDISLMGSQKISYNRDPAIAFEMLLFKLMSAPKLMRADTFAEQIPQPSQPAPVNREKTTAAPTQQPTPAKKVQAQQVKPRPEPRAQATSNVAPNTKPAPAEEKKPSVPPPAAPGEKTWEQFVINVKSSNGFLGALLEHTCIFREDDQVITLGLPAKMSFLLDRLQEEKNRERTQKFLQTLWQDSRTIEVEVLGKKEAQVALSPKAKEDKAIEVREQKDKESVESHPLVQATEKIFKGKIVNIKEAGSNTSRP